MDHWKPAVIHAFKGERFEAGHLDVEVMPELAAYRELVVDVAKSLWQRENPDRKRLPRRFEEGFRLGMSALSRGSAIAALVRNAPAGEQLDLVEVDVFDRSMRLVEESVSAASMGKTLPSLFPRSALPRFRKWGASLAEGEWIELRNTEGTTLATYNGECRANLIDRIDTTHENAADEVGFVLATSIRAGRFELYRSLHAGEGVVVPLAKAHEEKVIRALSRHDQAKLRVAGTGAFSADGTLVRFTQVERIDEVDREVDNRQLWAHLDALSAEVPENVWGTLGADAAENHDAYM